MLVAYPYLLPTLRIGPPYLPTLIQPRATGSFLYSRTVPVSSVPRICCLLSRHGAKAGCNYLFGRKALGSIPFASKGGPYEKRFTGSLKRGPPKALNQEGDLPISTTLPKPQKRYLIKLSCILHFSWTKPFWTSISLSVSNRFEHQVLGLCVLVSS